MVGMHAHASAIHLLLVASTAAATATARAESRVSTIGQVGVQLEDTTNDFGRLHINASLLGYQISAPNGGVVSTASMTFDLLARVAIRGYVATPLLLFAGGDHAPWRGEAMLQLWTKNRYDVEKEEVELARQYTSDEMHKQYIDMPIVNHNKSGLGVGLMYDLSDVKVDTGGSEQTISEHNLIAVAGIHGMNSAGYTVNVSGYGKRANYRWMTGGLDAMYAVVTSNHADVGGKRWGGRLWVETTFFKPGGVAGRLELGKYPGHVGWMLLASVGVGMHL